MIEITATQFDQLLQIGIVIVWLYGISLVVTILKIFHVPDLVFVTLVLRYEKRLK